MGQRGGESAMLEIGQERLPCHLWIGPSLAQQEGPGLVAVREGESWYVSTHSALNARDVSAPRYGVDRLEVIDPSIAALKRAEYGAVLRRQCGWKPSRRWSCESPSEEEMRAIGGFDGGDVFGSRIVVGAEAPGPQRKAA